MLEGSLTGAGTCETAGQLLVWTEKGRDTTWVVFVHVAEQLAAVLATTGTAVERIWQQASLHDVNSVNFWVDAGIVTGRVIGSCGCKPLTGQRGGGGCSFWGVWGNYV